MVRWGFRARLLVVTAVLLVLAVLVGDLFLSRSLEADLVDRIRADLEVRLALVEAHMRRTGPGEHELSRWDALADEVGEASRARVTFVDSRGTVLGDSEVPLAELGRVANHGGREEIKAAFRAGMGWAQRQSSTVERRMLYLARRSTTAAGWPIVVRLAVRLTEVEEAQARLRQLMFTGSGVALAVALLLSALTSQVFGRSLRAITDAARQIAEGNLDVRIRPQTRDEIGQLAGTLDQLADSLSTTLRALREERDRLGRILEAMEEGVLVVDAAGAIVMANPAARVLLLSGFQASDDSARRAHATAPLLGRSLLEAVRSAGLEAIVSETLDRQRPTSGEVAVDRPRPRRLLVHAGPLSSDGGGALVVLVDVTEIRRLESIRKDFVANVSHELRTPLTAVRTALETARAALKQEPREADRFLAIADRHTDRLTALVKDLLDLSRVESGNLQLVREPVAVREVAAEVVDMFGEPAARRQVRLSVQCPPDLPLVSADREALVQVLTNLVENAVKYVEEGGTVTVRAVAGDDAAQAGVVCVLVEDSGPGIAAKHLPRLFERFYRVDPGRSRDRGGTGLGLSIVKHLVDAMDGEVSVASTPGKGSTFTVRLPRHPGHA
jgi:two-component system phosphate regulon sensor histidine kinase PhoR